MGCGKSKHDVVSGNTTTLQREKPHVSFKENETGTKQTNNNNIDNESLFGQVEKIEKEIVKENGDEEYKDDEINDGEAKEKINDEENKEGNLVEEPLNDVGKKNYDALIKNGEKINDEETNVTTSETNDEGEKN